MGFICDEGIDPGFFSAGRSAPSTAGEGAAISRPVNVPIIESKIRCPSVEGAPIQRRLVETIKRSIKNYSGTMLVGRAGSGKTFLAANIAAGVKGTKWYTLDAGDADWTVFQLYFRTLILGKKDRKKSSAQAVDARTPFELVADVSASLERSKTKWPRLIVLDGIHHLYDCDWFKDLSEHLIQSLPAPAHLMITSRSKPPNSLWRLRSKQMLNVIDEKLLEISLQESEELFSKNGLSRGEARRAHVESYGRAGNLIRILNSKTSVTDVSRPVR